MEVPSRGWSVPAPCVANVTSVTQPRGAPGGSEGPRSMQRWKRSRGERGAWDCFGCKCLELKVQPCVPFGTDPWAQSIPRLPVSSRALKGLKPPSPSPLYHKGIFCSTEGVQGFEVDTRNINSHHPLPSWTAVRCPCGTRHGPEPSASPQHIAPLPPPTPQPPRVRQAPHCSPCEVEGPLL